MIKLIQHHRPLVFWILVLTFVFTPSTKIFCSGFENLSAVDTADTNKECICTVPYLNETNITDPNHPLVVESKKAILSTGISEAYFRKHFKLLCAVDNYPGGHRLVRWMYNIGEYITILKDNIGTIQYDLKGLREIRKVIGMKKAKQIMKRCIGEFKEPFVSLGIGPVNYEQAKLHLVARSVKEIRGLDIIWDVGWVDLETGKCAKSKGKIIHAPLGPTPKDTNRR